MIDFGEWISKNQMSLHDNVYGLFNDSYRCLMNGIDRPAYLLAYQGMLQHIKYTVLQSPSIPSGFTSAEWTNQWVNPLKNDDKWEETAFKCTQQKNDPSTGKAAVLNIRQEVREKFVFWRQMRNVCAHYKGYDLHKAHSLALYSFIEQYLFTLTVEGSLASLNSMFDDYFNPALTSTHEDIHPLLNRIDVTIQDGDFPTFFSEMEKSCSKYASYNSRFNGAIHEIVSYCSKRVRDAAIEYVRSDTSLLNDYLEHYPNDVLDIISGLSNIHNYWYASLPSARKKFTILALMLAADIIPDVDKKDAMKKCLSQAEMYSSLTDYFGISQELAKVLADNGLFDLFYDIYFNPDYSSRNYQDICYKTDFYMGIISLIPWDKKYVEHLRDVFSAAYFPYTLATRLKEKYTNDTDYKAAVDAICSAEGIVLPSQIA